MVNPIQITQPQAYSGGADFTPLAGLYDVYKRSQERAMQEAALARLGPNMEQNTQALIASGVPGLASQGLNLQQAAINRQREDAQHAITNARLAEAMKLSQSRFGIEQSQERRVQEEYAKKLADEAEAARIMSGFAGITPRGAATPFPAPLPGAAPAPSSFPAPLPGAAPQAPPALQAPGAPPAAAVAEGGDGGGDSGGGPAKPDCRPGPIRLRQRSRPIWSPVSLPPQLGLPVTRSRNCTATRSHDRSRSPSCKSN